MSFAQQFNRQNTANICLLLAPDDTGQDAWYFVRVEPTKLQRFQKDAANQGIDITSYGEVLESGYGDYPPQEVIGELSQKYNLPESLLKKLL